MSYHKTITSNQNYRRVFLSSLCKVRENVRKMEIDREETRRCVKQNIDNVIVYYFRIIWRHKNTIASNGFKIEKKEDKKGVIEVWTPLNYFSHKSKVFNGFRKCIKIKWDDKCKKWCKQSFTKDGSVTEKKYWIKMVW